VRAKSTYSSETRIKLGCVSQSDNRQVGVPGDMLNFPCRTGRMAYRRPAREAPRTESHAARPTVVRAVDDDLSTPVDSGA
jgi:hypothetical protein